jgi:hypothetical protein
MTRPADCRHAPAPASIQGCARMTGRGWNTERTPIRSSPPVEPAAALAALAALGLEA